MLRRVNSTFAPGSAPSLVFCVGRAPNSPTSSGRLFLCVGAPLWAHPPPFFPFPSFTRMFSATALVGLLMLACWFLFAAALIWSPWPSTIFMPAASLFDCRPLGGLQMIPKGGSWRGSLALSGRVLAKLVLFPAARAVEVCMLLRGSLRFLLLP